MKIKINDLQEIQNSLDSRIFALHNTSRIETRADRVLALLVEVGELANETRCFKYWSLRAPSESSVIFEELSDVVHFALSLGIDIQFDDAFIEYDGVSASLNDQFHNLYQTINTFSTTNLRENYRELLVTIFNLAHSLGLDGEGIRTMYLLKNEKNHLRQDNNY